MDKYTKMFIRASVLYLGLGVLFGLYMAATQVVWDEARFIHVHVMLLGFLAMMIYGVAYHILPRFNAVPMLYPTWVPVHFWTANIGLWGMCITYAMGGPYSDGIITILFGAFSTLEGAAIFIFIINILSVLKTTPAEEPVVPSKPATEDQAEPEAPTVKIAPSMKISEIVEKYPHLGEALSEEGFGALVTSEAIGTVAKMVSLEMAAKKADIDLFPLIARLEGGSLLKTSDDTGSDKADSEQNEPAKPAFAGAGINRGELATAKTLIGPLLEIYPETKPVFEKHYGASCFSCPGQQTETIEQTAGMHGMPTQKILDEINAIIETVM
jgi:cytochrome c oxidase cbb3-type subunit 1